MFTELQTMMQTELYA